MGDWRLTTVALTGVIGSGKSTAARLFSELGASVISADQAARDAVIPGSPEYLEVIRLFGRSIVSASGKLDRRAIADAVFANPALKRALEQLIHPRVQELVEQKVIEAQAGGAPLIVYEIPLLFETGQHQGRFWRIVLVSAREDVCLARIMERDKISHQAAKRRFDSQIPLEVKEAQADIVLDNSGTLADLRKQTEAVFSRLLEEAQAVPRTAQ